MGESENPSGLVQGTLDMLILRTLALEPMHGYGIGVRLEQISRGALRVNAGSLFPAFRRLERDGEIARGMANDRERPAREVPTRSRTAGRQTLARTTKEWQRQTAAISRVLKASLGEL